jgi:hypothetical protein
MCQRRKILASTKAVNGAFAAVNVALPYLHSQALADRPRLRRLTRRRRFDCLLTMPCRARKAGKPSVSPCDTTLTRPATNWRCRGHSGIAGGAGHLGGSRVHQRGVLPTCTEPDSADRSANPIRPAVQSGRKTTAQLEFGLLVGLRAGSNVLDRNRRHANTSMRLGASLMRIVLEIAAFPNAFLTLNVLAVPA